MVDLFYACHIKTNNWGKLLKHNISKISNYCSNIYIIYSIDENLHDFNQLFFENQFDNPNIILMKVDNYGYDFFKWKVCLERHQTFSNTIILMNDSFVFIKDIDNIMNEIKTKINNDVKFIGFSESDINKKHYQSWFWVLDNSLISEFCSMVTDESVNCENGSMNVILNCEIEISNYFINKYISCSIYHTNSDNLILESLEKLIDNGYPVVKLQCLKRAKYEKDEKITDFDANIYKNLHSDLKHLTDKELITHFFMAGIHEGRKYKSNQQSYIPEKIKLGLNLSGLLIEDFLI